MRSVVLAIAAFAVAGCASSGGAPIHPAPPALTGCAAIAQDRVNDAAANGYDAVMQDVVYKDAYNSCAALEIKRASTPAK